MKIYFIQPTPYWQDEKLIKKKKLYFVGLAPAILASLSGDWDFELCLETIEEVNFESDADIIAISGMGHAVMRGIDIAKKFKEKGKTVVMGGYMVSLMPQEAKKYCDSVIIGDGELAFPKMLEDYVKGNLREIYDLPLEKLTYPLPKYEILTSKKIGDFLPVQAGRGCPNSCSFCSVYCIYKNRYLRREITEVIRDIKYIKSLGYNKFLLLDDNILSDREYMLSLCEELKKLNMKWLSQCEITIADDEEVLKAVADSGCIALSFGIESISQESLNAMNKHWAKVESYKGQIKKIQEAGIDISTEMVIGGDGDTIDTIRATSKFIMENKIAVPRFYILTPIPGTIFYEEIKKSGRLVTDNIYKYNGAFAVHKPKNMDAKTLTKEYWKLYKATFSMESILKRTIFKKDFVKHPLKNIFYFYVNMYYKYQISKGITPNII